MTIACICNIAGDLLLVGKFGMGSAGAAIATVAAQNIDTPYSEIRSPDCRTGSINRHFMSKIPCVSLFQVGFATPLATVFAIIITVIYLGSLSKRRQNTVDIG